MRHDWIESIVQEEWRCLGVREGHGVHGHFYQWEVLEPCAVGVQLAEKRLNSLVGAFCLTVGLWMVCRCRFVNDVQLLEEILEETGEESGIPI